MKIILHIVRWIIIAGIFLFALATWMNGAYGQTVLLLLIAFFLGYWPKYFRNKWNNKVSIVIRTVLIVVLFAINQVFFQSGPKKSIYISEPDQQNLMTLYDQQLNAWPPNTEDIFIDTKYGKIHILACGAPEDPPIVMIHAASMGAHSWAENLEPLIGEYRIYAIDNIGSGNKSQLNSATVYPTTPQKLAQLYASITEQLDIDRSHVFGASNGGFIAMNYAFFYPEKVISLALFGPMGLTPLSGKSIMMLSIASMYPAQFVRNKVTRWALGDDPYVIGAYGDWFNGIMKSTIPSLAHPIPMTKQQKSAMTLPILLFLGTEDPIVGSAHEAAALAADFPNIEIEILNSSHLIAVQKADDVNKKIKSFLQDVSDQQ